MQKIYLLLRSNKQTGPYTFEELLQLNLKPFDLVWVEGRSAAWQYPFEIPALKPHVPETPQAAIPFQPVATATMDSKPVNHPYAPQANGSAKERKTSGRVFVSVPKNYQQAFFAAAENQASVAARQNFEQPVTKTPVPEPEPLRTNYTKPLQEVEEDYTSWVYQQKTRKKAKIATRDLVIAGLLLAVIGGGYYVVSRPAVTNKILPGNHPAARVIDQTQTPATSEPEGNTAGMQTEQVQQSQPVKLNQPPAKAKHIQAKNPATAANTQTVPSAPAQNTIPGEKTISNIPADDAATPTSSEKNDKSETAGPKKKKLGEMIRGIFARKNPPPEEQTEDASTQEPRPANNRQATRRETADVAVQPQTTVTEISPKEIELYSNHSNNWMMGVRDLEITLRNRSSVVIGIALVSVKYYDENNRLLDKKTIRFENVAANGKQTMAAPENKWADHADFELVSATAKDDRYASHQ